MAKRGQRPTVLPPDDAFAFYYNDGNRRTYGAVAAQFKCSYNTVRNAADEHDWDGRAEELDRKAREIVDAKLATLKANATIRVAELAMAGITMYARRFMPKVQDKDGKIVDNPDMLSPGELDSGDLIRFAKALELTGVIGPLGGSDGTSEMEQGLAELRVELAGMYEREQLALEAADVGEFEAIAAPAADQPA